MDLKEDFLPKSNLPFEKVFYTGHHCKVTDKSSLFMTVIHKGKRDKIEIDASKINHTSKETVSKSMDDYFMSKTTVFN